jgi:DNA-binding MarR family transcriptional regulator
MVAEAPSSRNQRSRVGPTALRRGSRSRRATTAAPDDVSEGGVAGDVKRGEVDGVLMRTAKALRRAYEAALEEQLDITLNEASVLSHLTGRRPLTQVELARRVGVSRARIGVHIDALMAKDAVRREADPSDRRVWKVSLTGSGRSLRQQSAHVNRTVRARVHQGLTDDDLDVLDRLLRIIYENVVMFSDDVG